MDLRGPDDRGPDDREQAIEQVKRECLLHLFAVHGGNMERIVAALGVARRDAYRSYARAGLRPEELRSFARSRP